MLFRSYPPWAAQRSMAAVGAILAIATLLKPTYLIFLPLPLLYPVVGQNHKAYRLLPLVSCILTYLAVVAVSMVVMLRSVSSVEDFIDILYFLSSTYSPLDKRHPISEISTLPLTLFQLGLLIPYLLTPVGIWVIYRSGHFRLAGLMAAWFALSLLSIIIQGAYLVYHFLPATVSAATTLGYSWALVSNRLKILSLRHLWSAAAALVVASTVLAPLDSTDSIWRPHHLETLFDSFRWPCYLLGSETKDQHIARITGEWIKIKKVADYIVGRSRADDRVLAWGFEVGLYVLSNRRPPTRFGLNYGLQSEGPLKKKYRQIFMKEVKSIPPLYITVDCDDGECGRIPSREFPEFSQFLSSRYKLERRLDRFEIWVRR